MGSKSLAQIYPEAMFGNNKKSGDAVLVFGSTGKMGRAIVEQVHLLHCLDKKLWNLVNPVLQTCIQNLSKLPSIIQHFAVKNL